MYANSHTQHNGSQNRLTGHRPECSPSNRRNEPEVVRKGQPISIATSGGLETLAVRVAQNRDRKAFQQLFAHFAPRIKSFILKQNVSDEIAEDLTQEVMVTIWQKAHLYDPKKARLSTWIFRIARNKFIDKIRRQRYIEVDVDDHIQSMEAEEKTDIPVIQKQDQQRILNALKLLKPDLQQVVELAFYRELSHSQIAEETGLPLGTVKSRLRIAFQKLRTELGDEA